MTAVYFYLNTLFLGSSSGRIYCYRVNRLRQLLNLRLGEPDLQFGQRSDQTAVRQIEVSFWMSSVRTRMQICSKQDKTMWTSPQFLPFRSILPLPPVMPSTTHRSAEKNNRNHVCPLRTTDLKTEL